MGMRRLLLGRVWVKKGLLDKMGLGKGHFRKNKGFGTKLGSLRKEGVRKGLFSRKKGF